MQNRFDQFSPIPSLTPVTKNMIITCVVVYFLDLIFFYAGVRFHGLDLKDIFGLVPALVVSKHWYWQFVTYIFLHGHHLHLLLNMLILWYFGAEIESRMGTRPFLKFFFIAGIGAGLFNFGVNALTTSDISTLMQPIIGASGAIYGILAAYGIFFSERYFLVFFIFPMKAKYFVLLMAAIELLTGLQNGGDNVAHFAHLGGMIIGGAYIYARYGRWDFLKRSKSNKKDEQRERLKKQFTLIVNQNQVGSDKKTKSPENDPNKWN